MLDTRLEELRENAELTKKELADILNVSDSVYSRWEKQKEFIKLLIIIM